MGIRILPRLISLVARHAFEQLSRHTATPRAQSLEPKADKIQYNGVFGSSPQSTRPYNSVPV